MIIINIYQWIHISSTWMYSKAGWTDPITIKHKAQDDLQVPSTKTSITSQANIPTSFDVVWSSHSPWPSLPYLPLPLEYSSRRHCAHRRRALAISTSMIHDTVQALNDTWASHGLWAEVKSDCNNWVFIQSNSIIACQITNLQCTRKKRYYNWQITSNARSVKI